MQPSHVSTTHAVLPSNLPSCPLPRAAPVAAWTGRLSSAKSCCAPASCLRQWRRVRCGRGCCGYVQRGGAAGRGWVERACGHSFGGEDAAQTNCCCNALQQHPSTQRCEACAHPPPSPAAATPPSLQAPPSRALPPALLTTMRCPPPPFCTLPAGAPSRALTRMLTTKHLDDEHEEELVLALLPPYRRRAQRHKVRQGRPRGRLSNSRACAWACAVHSRG